MRRSATDGSIMDEDRAEFQVTLAGGSPGSLAEPGEQRRRSAGSLKQQLDEAKRTIARQEAEIQRQSGGNPRVETTNATPGRREPKAGPDGMPLAGGSAAEGAQVWSPHDPSGGESGADRRLASGRASFEDRVGVAWGASSNFLIGRRFALGCCASAWRPCGSPSNRPTIGFGWRITPIKLARRRRWSCWACGPRNCRRQEKPSSMRMSTC